HQILQTYYQQFKGGNADTRDFQQVAESVSGKNLEPFFKQWLYQPGLPQLKLQWKWTGNKVMFMVQQTNESKFQFPLEIAFVLANGKKVVQQINITPDTTAFELPLFKKPVKVILDP